jgi:hypothetical protein
VPELSEMIRDYVDAVAPRISLDDVRERMERGSDASAVRPERRHASVALVVAAAALALALVATLLIVPTGSPPPSAAAVLNEVAMVAAARPKGPVPHSHEYLYYEMTQGSVAATPVSDGHASVLYRYTDVENTWVAPDGTGRQRIAFAAGTPVLPSQRAQWNTLRATVGPSSTSDTTFPTSLPTGIPSVGGPLVHTTGTSYVLSYLDINAFPTQPAALKRNIERYLAPSGAISLFYFAGNALQVGARPALRAALFEVVEHLPGVTLLGRTRDASGRVGVGVALNSTPQLCEILVFNPHTSAVLGDLTLTRKSTSVLGTVVPKGTMINFTTYGSTGVTSSVTRLPGGTKVPLTSGRTSSADGS